MNYQLAKSDRIYVFQNGSYIKPIKLIYEGQDKITCDSTGTITIPTMRFGSFSLDDCEVNISLLNKLIDRKSTELNNGVYFKSLL